MTSSSRVCGELAGDTESLSGALCLSGENNIKRHQWCDVTVVFICILKRKKKQKQKLLISVLPLKYDLQEATSATRRPHDQLLCFSLLTFLPCALVFEKKNVSVVVAYKPGRKYSWVSEVNCFTFFVPFTMLSFIFQWSLQTFPIGSLLAWFVQITSCQTAFLLAVSLSDPGSNSRGSYIVLDIVCTQHQL